MSNSTGIAVILTSTVVEAAEEKRLKDERLNDLIIPTRPRKVIGVQQVMVHACYAIHRCTGLKAWDFIEA